MITFPNSPLPSSSISSKSRSKRPGCSSPEVLTILRANDEGLGAGRFAELWDGRDLFVGDTVLALDAEEMEARRGGDVLRVAVESGGGILQSSGTSVRIKIRLQRRGGESKQRTVNLGPRRCA